MARRIASLSLLLLFEDDLVWTMACSSASRSGMDGIADVDSSNGEIGNETTFADAAEGLPVSAREDAMAAEERARSKRRRRDETNASSSSSLFFPLEGNPSPCCNDNFSPAAAEDGDENILLDDEDDDSWKPWHDEWRRRSSRVVIIGSVAVMMMMMMMMPLCQKKEFLWYLPIQCRRWKTMTRMYLRSQS
mmetsp:Transcript_23683/g.45081  ORF Transcript_23683/g.45081 Transcript_23683/m.45081 type:complete len:191 (-) Transcript_23683:255-827(-)